MKLKIFISILSLFMLGCSSSKITSSWIANNVQSAKYSKIMVLGLIREKDRTIREKMEEHLIGDLHDLGYNAISSMSVFGPRAFKRMTEDSALNNIQNVGADAVITIVLLDKSKEQHYVPPQMRYSGPIYTNRFWGYYSTMYDRIYTPGYYVTDTKYFWESNFYDMASKQLLYSVQTQSFSPSSSEKLGHEYGKLIVNDMVKKHVLIHQ